MRFKSPRGTRDFYPEDYKLLRWLFDTWRKTSIEHGFLEYEGPIFEHLELYEVKSGEEIVEQLFSFEDRGGRRLAIRPEITPTLARMIAAKSSTLKLPIKWFSIPRLCRAERPQRGRLREFFQWNIDIIGSDDVISDAECIFTALDFLRKVGLDPENIELRVNSRTIISSILSDAGIEESRHTKFFTIMDKFEKLSEKDFEEYAQTQSLSPKEIDIIKKILSCQNLEDIQTLAVSKKTEDEINKLVQLNEYLDMFGVGEFFVYKPSIVRGLAYYTGVVYEIFDKASKFRAIAGGGRYDNLIELFGGPKLPATGFGMGDVVLTELLKDLHLLPDLTRKNEIIFFVIDAEASLYPEVLKLTGHLRQKGWAADFSYKRQHISKQLKLADARGARYALILGEETIKDNRITVKELLSARQLQLRLEDIKEDPAIVDRAFSENAD